MSAMVHPPPVQGQMPEGPLSHSEVRDRHMEWPHLIALHINRYMKILFIVAIIFAVIAFVALTLGCTTIAAGVFSLALGSIGTMLGLRP